MTNVFGLCPTLDPRHYSGLWTCEFFGGVGEDLIWWPGSRSFPRDFFLEMFLEVWDVAQTVKVLKAVCAVRVLLVRIVACYTDSVHICFHWYWIFCAWAQTRKSFSVSGHFVKLGTDIFRGSTAKYSLSTSRTVRRRSSRQTMMVSSALVSV